MDESDSESEANQFNRIFIDKISCFQIDYDFSLCYNL